MEASYFVLLFVYFFFHRTRGIFSFSSLFLQFFFKPQFFFKNSFQTALQGNISGSIDGMFTRFITTIFWSTHKVSENKIIKYF